MNQRPNGGGGFVTGFFIGALLGVSVATLISPEEGRGSGTERIRGLYSRGKEIVGGARTDFEAAVEEAKSAASGERERLERLQK